MKIAKYLIVSGSIVFSLSAYALDTFESLSGILDFDMTSFQGKPGSQEDLVLAKAWNSGMDRVHKYLFTAFRESELPALAKRVDELGKEIFKVEIYKSKLKPYNQPFTEYKDEIYNSRDLLQKIDQLEKKKDALKKDINKKQGFKEKAKLFFSSKTTKAIKSDEQEGKAFLSTIVDRLSGVLERMREIIKNEQSTSYQETKRRQG